MRIEEDEALSGDGSGDVSRGRDNKQAIGGSRKRDHSWDKKWFHHLEQQQVEQVGTFRFRNPGKIKARAKFLQKSVSLPPKSPGTRRRINPSDDVSCSTCVEVWAVMSLPASFKEFCFSVERSY